MSEGRALVGVVVEGATPPELAVVANREHALARQSGASMFEHAWRSGEALAAAKAQVGHGGWLPWLAANFDGSERIAQMYMRVAANPQRVSDLEDPSLRKALEAISVDARLADARGAEPEPVSGAVPLPEGKYRCIVIDPPWPMQKIERETRPDQGVALDYPVMSLDEIGALPVRDLAVDDGCHVYLWVTHKFLPAGLDLFETWGVAYQCVMTWVKNVGITPFSWMYDTEHVLFGRIGSLQLERLGLRLSFHAPTAGHSVKPDAFYELIQFASPGPRLDMFARRPRDGFDVWGNEVAG
jgi:N6-adenosine-specific RNA methylase IME4